MKLLELTIEGVKRISVAEIHPRPDLNQVTGKNGHGKSSVLDSILYLLAGGKNLPLVPIHRGVEEARIRGRLGDLIVERRFSQRGTTTLTVYDARGAGPGTPDNKLPVHRSPQELLDTLLGDLSFDPLVFAEAPSKEQYQQLKAVAHIDVDLDALDAANAADFKSRTDISRDAKAMRARAEGIQVALDTPPDPVDETALIDAIQQAGDHNARIEAGKARRESTQRDANDTRAAGVRVRNASAAHRERTAKRVLELQQQLAEFQVSAETSATDMDEEAFALLTKASALEDRIDGAPALPEPIDVGELRGKLNAAKMTNLCVAARQQKCAFATEATELEAKAASLTQAMNDRAKQQRAALEHAEMPVAELTLAAGQVLYNGLPFSQASDAERLKVSTAIAMAANPTLRVILIRNGSLLDDDSMAVIAELARDKDYQVWVERVDSSGKVGIVMEDGTVKADNYGGPNAE